MAKAVEPLPALAAELQEGLEGNPGPLRASLRDKPWLDPFKALHASDTFAAALVGSGFKDLDSWLIEAHRWIQDQNVPGVKPTAVDQVLRGTWNSLTSKISAGLQRTRLPGRLPDEGSVLAFVDGLDLCLLVGYRFVSAVPELRVIATIPNPRTVFDVVDILMQQPHEIRNELKTMMQSSHRLVWHRDVLIHVDRREDQGVFGPSIDTLHLAELITSRFADLPPDEQPARVLEVGTGSGLLSATALRNLSGVQAMAGFEVKPHSAFCTHRNWATNTEDRPGLFDKASLIVGRFDADLLAGAYDLVICNPPYIPRPPEDLAGRDGQGRHGAVAGLELLDELLDVAHRLVAPGGQLLLVVSSVTPRTRVTAPESFVDQWPWGEQGQAVLFELEEVFSSPTWLASLHSEGGLTMSGEYHEHRLHAVWLTRTEGK